MEHRMSKALLIIAVLLPIAWMPGVSSAKGCLKGAAVGGVVGHVAGHHAVAGAAAGCVIGHHRAKIKVRRGEEAQPQDTVAKPAAPEPVI
jgi:outer membrane lipoprotein SlyB